MGFEPCNTDPYIQLLPNEEDHYEHISVYADDLLISYKDSKSVTDVLTNKHLFKLKGTGNISYHLGCYFGRDGDSALHFASKK